MKSPKKDSLPTARQGSGIVSLKARRDGPHLIIEEAALSDAAVRMLIEEWLVPEIVERLIVDLLKRNEA